MYFGHESFPCCACDGDAQQKKKALDQISVIRGSLENLLELMIVFLKVKELRPLDECRKPENHQ